MLILLNILCFVAIYLKLYFNIKVAKIILLYVSFIDSYLTRQNKLYGEQNYAEYRVHYFTFKVVKMVFKWLLNGYFMAI